MANLKEIALGIASALQFGSEPEPLVIDLRGQTPESATFLVRSIIDECVDAGSALKRVRVDPELAEAGLAAIANGVVGTIIVGCCMARRHASALVQREKATWNELVPSKSSELRSLALR